MITKSKIDKNGRECFTMCVKCSIDGRNICNGKKVVVENNHKKNSYIIYVSEGNKITEIQKGKEETLDIKDFEKWLTEHGYVEDEHMCAKERGSQLN